MTKLLVLLALLTTTAVADMRNPPSSTERQYLYNKNNLSNGGFEGGKTGWSSAITLTTTSGQVAEGTQAGAWDPSGAGTVQSPTWTTKAATAVNAMGVCKVLTSDADYDLQIYDGTNIVASADVPSGTVFQNVLVNFVASASTTYRIRLSAPGDESVSYIDDCYLGEADNIGLVSQAQFVGSAYFAQTTNCSWSRTNTAVGAFGTDTDCPGPTVDKQVIGTWQTTDADLPKITINSLPPGIYKVTATASLYGGGKWTMAISDGTNTRGYASGGGNAAGNFQPANVSTAWFEYTTTGNRSFEIYGSSSFGAVSLDNLNSNDRTTFVVEKFPLSSETAVKADNSNYGWTAYTPTFTGFGTVSGTSCYHSRQGENLKVRCKFVPGTTTATEARVSFPGTLVAASTIPTLELAGTAVINVTTNGYASVLREPSVSYFTFGRDGGGSTAITKFNGSTWVVSGNTVSFLAEVPINGWSENQSAPQLINSVITPYDGVWKTLSASFGGASDGTSCGSSPCTVYRSSGSWISSITRGGTGDYTINFAAGTFSAAPNCSYQPQFGNNCGRVNNVTTSSAGVVAHGCSTGTATDSFGVITCAGPR